MQGMRGRPRGAVALPAWLAAAVLGTAVAGCGGSMTSSTPAASRSGGGAAGGAARSAGGGTAAGAGTAGCAGSRLAVSYAGTQGATGHLELRLALHNRTRRACRIRGYPAARLVDRRGRVLPLHVHRGHGFFPDTLAPPRTVVVPPGASAHFGISFATNDEYAHARTCRRAAGVLSSVSGSRWSRVSLSRAPRVSPCGDRVFVSPVHA